jgi:hypothetical protein
VIYPEWMRKNGPLVASVRAVPVESPEQWQVTRSVDAILRACLKFVATARSDTRRAPPSTTTDVEHDDAALVHLDELIAQRRRQPMAALPGGPRDAIATLDALIANRRHAPQRDAD